MLVKEILNNLKAIGEVIIDRELVMYNLIGLRVDYRIFVTTMNLRSIKPMLF